MTLTRALALALAAATLLASFGRVCRTHTRRGDERALDPARGSGGAEQAVALRDSF